MENRKNVLLLSAFWSGIRPFFLEGNPEFKGMPAFTNTFISLLNDERVGKIYVVFFGKDIDTTYHVPTRYKNKIDACGYSYTNKFSAVSSILALLTKLTVILISKKIYVLNTHGPIGGIGALLANLFRVKNVRRIYGTFLARKINHSKFRIFISHPLEYLTFSLSAKAVVITNDGTKGNIVFDKIGNKKTPLFFWLNGIKKKEKIVSELSDIQTKYGFNFAPDLCYIARIDLWKRQHLLVEMLCNLKKRNELYNTVIAGPVLNEQYYQGLIETVKENGLEENVIIIPGLTSDETKCVIKTSSLSVSFYDFSNLGNVFLESISLGTPMLTQNIDNSLDLIDKKIYYNVDPKNTIEAASKLSSIFKDTTQLKEKGIAAKEFSSGFLKTWEERIDMEIALLEL